MGDIRNARNPPVSLLRAPPDYLPAKLRAACEVPTNRRLDLLAILFDSSSRLIFSILNDFMGACLSEAAWFSLRFILRGARSLTSTVTLVK
jgi:hypothetical protein